MEEQLNKLKQILEPVRISEDGTLEPLKYGKDHFIDIDAIAFGMMHREIKGMIQCAHSYERGSQ